METKWNTLYSLDAKQRIKEWDIAVVNKGDHSVIQWNFGYRNCKKVHYTLQMSSGKNTGRSNATDHYTQAISEAQSRFNKKRDTFGYTESLPTLTPTTETPVTPQLTPATTSSGPVFPMLAHDYSKHSGKLQFPCYIQPKLDGYRMIYCNGSLTSRTGKAFTVLQNTTLQSQLAGIDHILDGELYVHNQPFESLGIVRKKTITSHKDRALLDTIEYHVYDIINDSPFSERLQLLQNITDKLPADISSHGVKVRVVTTYLCNDHSDILKYHAEFTTSGYEGSILRNANGLYRKKFRSTDLLKKKDFMDGEYTVTGFASESETKSNRSLVIWECTTDAGIKFHVRPQGTEAEREYLYTIANNFIGQKLWVKYFELTDRNVPRFPSTKTASYKSYFRNATF